MVLLSEALELTPEEKARIRAAPFRPGDDGWRSFAAAVHEQVLAAYASGEMDLRRVFEVMRSCSLGCSARDRIAILGLTAHRSVQIEPKSLKRKRPVHPTWVKNSAAALVQMLHEEFPDEPLAPNAMNRWRTRILKTAIAWLATLGLCDSTILPRTVYDWYRRVRVDGPLPNTR